MSKPDTQSIKFDDTFDTPRYYEMPLIGDRKPVQQTPEKIATKGPVLLSHVEVKPLGIFSLTDKKNQENNKEQTQNEEEKQNNAPVQIKTSKGLTISLTKPKTEKLEQTKQSKSVVVESSSRESKGFLREVQSSDPLAVLSSPQAELNDIVTNEEINNNTPEPSEIVSNNTEFIPVRTISAPVVYNQTDLNNNEEKPENEETSKPQLVASFKPSPFVIKQNVNYDDFDFEDDDDDVAKTKIDNTRFLNEVMGIEEEPINNEPDFDEVDNESIENINNNNQEEEEIKEEPIINNQQDIEEQNNVENEPTNNDNLETNIKENDETEQNADNNTEEKEVATEIKESEKPNMEETSKSSSTKSIQEDADESIIPPTPSKTNQSQNSNTGIIFAGVIFLLVLIMFRTLFK